MCTDARRPVSRVRGQTATGRDPHEAQEHIMSLITRSVKKHIKARQRRRRTAQERLGFCRKFSFEAICGMISLHDQPCIIRERDDGDQF
jgi:hypothetical protein